jgi:hypothetical protein
MQKTYSQDIMKEVYRKIGVVDNDEQKYFYDRICDAGERYKFLSSINAGGIQKNIQKRKFNAYIKALSNLKKQQEFIDDSVILSGKLNKSIRNIIANTKSPSLKDMFYPYYTDTGYSTSILHEFLNALIQAAKNAPQEIISNENPYKESNYLAEWVALIGKAWPKSAKIAFALGTRDNEVKEYTSQSIKTLHDLIILIDLEVEYKDIENSMRTVIKKNMINQDVAELLHE